jgi:hypothetical protein
MPDFSKNLEHTLHRAIESAHIRRHEYATIEHLLRALIDDPEAKTVLLGCDVNTSELSDTLDQYLDGELSALVLPTNRPPVPTRKPRRKSNETDEQYNKRVDDTHDKLKAWDKFEKDGPTPTSGMQRVVQRAILHVQSSGRGIVGGHNVLLAIFSERESYAAYFLQQQDLTRLDVVSYISHSFQSDYNKNNDSTEEDASSVFRLLTHDLRSLSDEISQSPVLSTPIISTKIVDFLSDLTTTNSPSHTLAIGIYGPWGSGKSTLLAQLSREFINDGAIVVHVNAWRWDGKEDLYLFMSEQILQSLSSIRKYKLQANLFRFLLFIRRNFRKFVISSVVFTLSLIAFFAVDWANLDWSKMLEKGSLFTVAATALAAILAKPIASVAEKLILRVGAKTDPGDILSVYYRYLLLAKKIGTSRRKPIYFIFDDLDRCEPDRVLSFLKSIHLLTSSGSISVIACDDRVVSAAIYKEYRDIADLSGDGIEFGRRFLEKIVQVHFRMPDLPERDLISLSLQGTVQQPQAEQEPDSERESSENEARIPADTPTKDLGNEEYSIDYIKMSYICDQILGSLIELYRIPIRRVKFISNLMKLYTMAFPPADESSALRMAAFIGITNVDPGFIKKYIFDDADWHGPDHLKQYHEKLLLLLGDDEKLLMELHALSGLHCSGRDRAAEVRAASDEAL